MNIIRFLLLGFMYLCNPNYAAEVMVNVDAKNSYFVGRKAEIGQLSLDFKAKPTILLKGSKGIGKTQIAKEYVWQSLSYYDFIWWINGSEDIEPQAIYFAKKMNVVSSEKEKINSAGNAELVFQKIIHILLNSNKKWLIVFDDVSYPINHLIDFNQLSAAKKQHILTTAYNCDFIKMFTSVINVKGFDRQDSITLLSGLDQKQYASDKNKLNELADLLYDHPLSVSQALAYLKNTSFVDIDQYIQFYRERAKELSKANYEVAKAMGKEYMDGYSLTTEITTSLTVDQVKKASQEAYFLLEHIVFLHHESISRDLMLQIFKGDKLSLSIALNTLLRFSLIDHKDSEEENSLYTMHGAVSDFIRGTIEEKRKKELFSMITSSINTIIPNSLYESVRFFVHYPYYQTHINFLSDTCLKNNYYSPDLVYIKVKLLEYVLTERRQKEASEKLINNIDELLKKQQIDCRIKAKYQLMKSTYYQWMLFDFEKSLAEANQAGKTLKSCPDSKEECAILYFRLTQLYAFQGDVDNVLIYANLFDETVNTAKNIPEVYKTIIYQAKAIALADMGNFNEAIVNLDQAIEISKKVSDFSSNIIGLLVYKAKFLSIMRENGLALSVLSELAGSLDKNFKGEKNIFSASVPIIKGNIEFNNANYANANALISESLEAISHQNKNRAIAFLYAIAAKTHAKLGNVEQAISYYGKAETMYLETLKYHKIHEISLLYFDMGIFYFGIHDYIRATDCLEKHESIFGKEHPNSIELRAYFLSKLNKSSSNY
jgi:tetratricopeptide (TPR) repeat protein